MRTKLTSGVLLAALPPSALASPPRLATDPSKSNGYEFPDFLGAAQQTAHVLDRADGASVGTYVT